MGVNNARRAELINLSADVAPLVKLGEYAKINEALICEVYRKGEHKVFKRFSQWKKEGKTIVKGSRGFAVWGKPLGKQKKDAGVPPEEISIEEMKYFPLCYLFSNAQVKEEVNNG